MYTLGGVSSVSVKPRLPFSISNLFFVSKGTLLTLIIFLSGTKPKTEKQNVVSDF